MDFHNCLLYRFWSSVVDCIALVTKEVNKAFCPEFCIYLGASKLVLAVCWKLCQQKELLVKQERGCKGPLVTCTHWAFILYESGEINYSKRTLVRIGKILSQNDYPKCIVRMTDWEGQTRAERHIGPREAIMESQQKWQRTCLKKPYSTTPSICPGLSWWTLQTTGHRVCRNDIGKPKVVCL